MKENNENKAKALEENKKNYSSENSTPQNGEDIISNEDAEKLEGGIKHEDLERPSASPTKYGWRNTSAAG